MSVAQPATATQPDQAAAPPPAWLAELEQRATHWSGDLTVDPAAREAAATDAGNLDHRRPAAVFRAGTAEAVAELLRHTGARGIPVAVRGAGHCLSGHALTDGVVLTLVGGLGRIGEVDAEGVIQVGAAAMLADLDAAAFAAGHRPAAGLPDYHGLTVGGVLAVGGISAWWREGTLADRVRRLRVVTGRGEILLASATEHRDLFEAALAGLGAVGVITDAWLELTPAQPRVQLDLLDYADAATAFAAMDCLMDNEAADEVYLWVQRPGTGGRPGATFQVHAYQHTDRHETQPLPVEPEPEHRLTQLVTYPERSRMITEMFDSFRTSLSWDDTTKLWDDVLLSGQHAEHYLTRRVAAFTPADWATEIPQFVLAFPHRRSAFTRPAFAVPAGDSDRIVLVDTLRDRGLPGADPSWTATVRGSRRGAHEQARADGGVAYPIWGCWDGVWPHAARLGEHWRDFAETVARYNPHLQLNQGTGLPAAIRAELGR
ncbi:MULTISPECIES: FAD-binding protein [unclassified Crossiella]|uniref:FAD-binding protein n=1 Tax=unclassified Crossiella TaxID=2620835 RepID=UPI001FFFA92E|nr:MULTISPECIES: FAD-binding protein [unclassified Crossiella]MCK2241028.1 FAD-binding protein [Crossiella sp. S99.2]MCK2253828.1 FAD-binding protein [Crossiella sp. S99.1]